MTIKKGKTVLKEDFLSDQNTAPITAAQVAGTPEQLGDDDDFSDLLGSMKSKDDTKEKSEDVSQITDVVSSLKDTINSLSVTVQELKNTVSASNATPPPAPAPAPAEPPVAEPASQDAPPNLDLDDVPPAEPQAETAPQPESTPEDKPIEDKPDSEDDGSRDESAPGDETKTEAYRENKKFGNLLNSNTGSVIGIVESGKLYKLDEMLMTIVQTKIRQRIDEAKKELKADLLRESAGIPKAESTEKSPESETKIVEEKKDESMSFLQMIKSAKACNSMKCDDSSTEKESKKTDDEKKSEDSKKEDSKKDDSKKDESKSEDKKD